MEDRYDLERFVDAQEAVYTSVLNELKSGCKRGHWMWFIFPQIHSLGTSYYSQKYAIAGRGEALAYLDHSTLGQRLRECTGVVLELQGCTAEEIFGHPDILKFRSSMTLFMMVTSRSGVFGNALGKYFQGELDMRTLKILKDG